MGTGGMFLVAKLIAFAFVGVAVAHPQINPTQKRRVDQVVSVFENETLELQYHCNR